MPAIGLQRIVNVTLTAYLGYGVQIGIVAAEGKDEPVGESGKLLIRQPSITTGYWQLPETTAGLKDGWYRRRHRTLRCRGDVESRVG